MTIKTQELLMLDHHGQFIWTSGGIITEKEWSFSAINIHKAILKLKFENAPSGLIPVRFGIEYFDTTSLEWKVLGEIVQDWCGLQWCPNKYGEFDVTSICRANPKFKWRAFIYISPTLYYTCMVSRAYMYLEYTTISGEPETIGVQTTSIFGNEALAPVAEGFSLVINIMFMMMFMSLIMSMIESIVGG